MAITLQSDAVNIAAELSALLTTVAVAPLDATGWIRVTGEDRVRWLNGMVTNAIQALAPGEGCYNLVLNAQGRIQGDLIAFALPDSLLLETADAGKLATWFDQYIIMDDVELAVLRNGRAERESAASGGHPFLAEAPGREGILVAGPEALRIVSSLGGNPCSTSPPPTQNSTVIDLKQTEYRGHPVDLIRAYSPLVPCFEIWADSETMAQISAELASVTKASPEAVEQFRILCGTPRYGIDIRNTASAHDLPQETAQTRALNFSKGCYLGQEIVERIRSRGNVHRTFCGFQLTGALPAAGTALTAEGKPVGELTSVALIPLPSGPIQLALGYVRREALDRNVPLEYPGGAAQPISLPYALP